MIIEMIESNAIQLLSLALLSLVGFFVRQILQDLRRMGRKVGKLSDDMLRVKIKLNLDGPHGTDYLPED